MKNVLKYDIILLVFLMLSCSNDDNNPAPVIVAPTNILTATIDGVAYRAEKTSIVAENVTTLPTKLTITSTTSKGIFQFVLDNHVGVGNYTINGVGGYTLVMKLVSANSSDPFATNTCGNDEGILTITKSTTTEIEGTFSFIGKQMGSCTPTDGKTVTNGTFKSLLTQ